MKYRKFGRDGAEISALGFGCMRFPEFEKDGKWYIDEEKAIPMLQRAYEKGVNYFDTAPFYCNSNSEVTLGKAFHGMRDKVMLSTKCPMGDEIKQTGDYRRWLEKSLEKMGTDYIDYYHFWACNRGTLENKLIGMNIFEEAAKAKEEGLIRHISFSFHDDPEVIREIIDAAKARGILLDSMLVQYNLLDRRNEEMISYAASQGMGVVAMGPVGGGRLAAPSELYAKLTGKPSIATYELAFKFVLGHPGMSCALSGMQTIDMVEQNVQVAENSELSEQEWKQLGESMDQLKKFGELYCTGCRYCQPCPAGIDIPHIFNMYTYHNVYGLTDHAKSELARYVRDGHATLKDCKNCGVCEKKCPQKLKIREELAKVEKILMSE